MTDVSPATAYRRIARGWSPEAAWQCPVGVPLWAWDAEQHMGRPIAQVMREEAQTARETGTSLAMLAEDLGCSYTQAYYYARKLGIRWPAGVSVRAKDARCRRWGMMRLGSG